MKAKKKLTVLLMAAFFALSLGVFAACANEEHSLSYVEKVQATCTEAGHEAYYLCSHCGKLFADENAETELSDADVAIAALGHNLTHHDAVEATCTVDGNIEYWSCSRCDLNFSDEAGTQEAASVTVLAGHDIEWVETVEPTVSAEGMLAHYECSKCDKFFEDADGETEISREKLVIAKLVEQAVSVTVLVYDTAGNKVESPDYAAISGELNLLGAYSANLYEGLNVKDNGELELTSAIVGEYTVDIYGYRRSTFTVKQNTKEYTLELYATIAYGSGDKVTVDDKTASITIEGSVADYQNTAWSGSAELVLSEDIAGSTGVVLEFNVKNITNSSASGNEEWASQRIAIQMARGYEGFLFFLPKGEANIFDMTDSIIRDEGKTRFGVDGSTYAWIDTLMRGSDGVNMRLVRTGDIVTLFVQNAESQWVSIGAVECADAETEIIIYGCGVEWEFSSVKADKLTYVPAKEATAEEPGNLTYYTDGTNYWFEDGEQTTEEDVMVYMPVDVTLTVNGIALDGTTPETVADGTKLTFASRVGNYTYTVGGEELTEMVAGSYTVTADGYRTEEITVSPSGGEVKVTLTKVITIGKGAEVLGGTDTDKPWSGQKEVPVPENLSENFLMEFTLKMSDFTQGFNDLGAWQRYAIRLTEGNTGFYFWSWNDGTAKTRIRQFSSENLTNAAKENADVNGDETGLGFITNALISENGLQLRILRAGNTFHLYALNGSDWVMLGSVDCAEGDTIDMEVYAGVGTYEWSNINFTEVTFVEGKDPVVGGADGNVAYYTDGSNYWLEDGTMTTEEGVVLTEVNVTLTVEGFALDGKTEKAVAAGTTITFTGAYGTYSYKMGETAPAHMLADTYTVTAEGYAVATLTVPQEGGALTLTLKEVITIAGAVADYTGNQWSDSVTLDVSDEVKQSTNVTLEFTVKNITNSQAGWPTDEWASQRIAIQMAEGNEGFLFFLPSGEANIFDMTDGGIADSGKTRFGESGSALSWIDELMRGENGVNMRIVREGANITLFVQNAETEWVEIGTVVCAAADAETEIIFYGCGVEWEFSSVTVTPAVQG